MTNNPIPSESEHFNNPQGNKFDTADGGARRKLSNRVVRDTAWQS